MCEHEYVSCPRCKANFECKVGTIMLCQCMVVTLDDNERDYIRKYYDSCLCAACIIQMKQEYNDHLFNIKLQRISTLFNQQKR